MTVSATPTVQGSSSSAALPLTTATSTHIADRDSAVAAAQQRLYPRAVTVIAQSISHLPPLSESASVFLAPDAEYRIRQIIQDAIKFMKHSKRTRLIPDDVNSALNLRNADPIFGFGPQSRKYTYSRLSSNRPPSASNTQQPRTRRPTQTDSSSIDVDVEDTAVPHALNPTKSSPPDPPSFSSVHGIPNLFFAVDKERNLADAIRQPLPPVPLEATVMAHWLAVDATQPSIPQNPTSAENDRKKEFSGTSHSSALPSKRRRVSAVKGPGGLTNRKRRRRLPSNGAEHQTQDSIPVEVKPRIKHNLSRELQFYFDYVRQSVFKNDSDLIDNCLDSISTEHGIVQLVPYLSTFVSRTVRKHMNDLPLLFTTMRLMNAMVANRAFKLETYLHQMLPACVSCIVGKRLCAHPKQDHWALRDLSAGLFRRVCDRYEKEYVDIKRRFVITLSEALGNIGRPLTTHYGAIVGFTALGQLTISKSLIPKLPDYAEKVKLVLDAADQSPVRRFEAAKVYCALAWAASVFVEDESEEDGDLPSTHSKHWDEQKKAKKKANVPSISAIEPETIEHLIPDAARLLPALQTEFGKKVEPLGDVAFRPDVASRILKDATAT